MFKVSDKVEFVSREDVNANGTEAESAEKFSALSVASAPSALTSLREINFLILALLTITISCKSSKQIVSSGSQYRQRIHINDGWKFMRYTSEPDKLIYDIRPEVTDRNDNIVADTKPTEAQTISSSEKVLKKWILPSANDFIKDPAKHHKRPDRNPGADFPFVKNNFNDNTWENVNLPVSH